MKLDWCFRACNQD